VCMAQSPYYSVGELSEVLRVSTKWLYQQLNKGNIPGAFKIATGNWFIDRDTFHETLKAKAQKPKPQRKETGRTVSRHDL